MTRVLPEPAPARIASGPDVAVTASRCERLRSSSSRSGEGVPINKSSLEEVPASGGSEAWLEGISRPLSPANRCARVRALPSRLPDQPHVEVAEHSAGAALTPADHRHGLALALPEQVVVVRPTSVGRALTTYLI